MKDIIKVYSKYLVLVISVFLVFFFATIIYNSIPFFKVTLDTKEAQSLIKLIIPPAFYHSLFNGLIISLFLYGVTALNFHHKNKFINFLLPILTSSLIVFFVFFYLNPSNKSMDFIRLNDARLYSPQKTFIEHNGSKYYFDTVNKNEINNIILIEDKNVSFFKKGSTQFTDDKIIIEIKEKKSTIKIIELPKSQLDSFDLQGNIFNKSFFTLLNNASYKFLFSKDIYAKMLFWFSMAIFILTITSIFKVKNNPILSLIFNLLFIILFYYGFNFIFDFYNKISKEVFSSQIIKDTFLGMLIIIISFFLHLFNFIFFKTHESEE